MLEADTRLAGDPTSPRAARRFVDDVLASWGIDGAAASVMLLVSELVTNAVLHARTGCTLRLEYDRASRLRVEVSDGGGGLPSRRRYSEESGTGRGLALLEALSLDWGVDPQTVGKTVWFLVDVNAETGGRDTAGRAKPDAVSPKLPAQQPRRDRPGAAADPLLLVAA